MKKTLALALVVMFVLSLASPAIGQDISHSISAQLEGEIDWKTQAGHLCNTGAEQKKTIMGSAEIFKLERSVVMIEGRLTVTDVNDYIAGDSSLVVTSVIELCAPPKMEFTTTRYIPIIEEEEPIDEPEEGDFFIARLAIVKDNAPPPGTPNPEVRSDPAFDPGTWTISNLSAGDEVTLFIDSIPDIFGFNRFRLLREDPRGFIGFDEVSRGEEYKFIMPASDVRMDVMIFYVGP